MNPAYRRMWRDAERNRLRLMGVPWWRRGMMEFVSWLSDRIRLILALALLAVCAAMAVSVLR